ncbi:hypothetical protein GCM10010193_00150 [Kitasatospora atroaurantiaca]|uniref:DUF1326 domain-containing protein n=1 Tax=Kitasatospora atroaurantiaca TaxID=285545 RepID=A0A561EK82_9ACTN|nr:DUF1326 domain-containing protein [Kitasatospora atroaurantiaca]TWE16025.1 hypothetical protein FB465_0984 [Kitasatospora atroaurantiaca]
MTYTISGNYVAACSCAVICGCAVDAQPRDAQGGTECRGAAVFHINEGNLDDLDLSGVDFAFYNLFPSHLTAGDWKVGLVVDSGASDEQAGALERLVSGREGGPFGELAQFFGEYLGMERAGVSLTDGETPGFRVEGRSEVSFEALKGMDGTPTTIKNAMFGFAPEYQVGKSTGSSDAFGLSFNGDYGERADFVFSSEEEGAVHGRV